MADELRQATRESAEDEVTGIVTQLGRTDDGMDSWTPSHIEVAVGLKPYGAWPSGKTKQDLIDELAKRYEQIPGMTVSFLQAVIDMVNDEIASAHTELVIRVFGREFGEMRRIAADMVQILKHVPGVADVSIDEELSTRRSDAGGGPRRATHGRRRVPRLLRSPCGVCSRAHCRPAGCSDVNRGIVAPI